MKPVFTWKNQVIASSQMSLGNPDRPDYTTEDDTAMAGSDYTRVSGTLTFGENDTWKPIDVPILDDDVDENEEQFKVKLSNPDGAAQGATVVGQRAAGS